MKKQSLALKLILTLLSSTIAGIMLVNPAKANYFPPPSIEISSPFPTTAAVHKNASVTLDVRVNILPSEPHITFIRYSLDGKANVTITDLAREDNVWYWTSTEGVVVQGTAFYAKSSLGNLTDGNHSLIVYAHYRNGKEMSRSREFTVDTHYKPPVELVILSPQEKTYTTAEVPLTFTINEPIQFAHCSIDMQLRLNESMFLSGNATLTGLSNGRHTIKLVVGTEKGMASQTSYFSVNTDNENGNALASNNPIPAIAIVVVGSIVVIAIVGFSLVYFKKRKGERI